MQKLQIGYLAPSGGNWQTHTMLCIARAWSFFKSILDMDPPLETLNPNKHVGTHRGPMLNGHIFAATLPFGTKGFVVFLGSGFIGLNIVNCADSIADMPRK